VLVWFAPGVAVALGGSAVVWLVTSVTCVPVGAGVAGVVAVGAGVAGVAVGVVVAAGAVGGAGAVVAAFEPVADAAWCNASAACRRRSAPLRAAAPAVTGWYCSLTTTGSRAAAASGALATCALAAGRRGTDPA
jgi:hypothetical protein